MEKSKNTLQTLDRGLQALSIIAQQDSGISIAELAARLEVHRAIAYRIVTTLEDHFLISRGADGVIRLGAGATLLAARFEPRLRAVAQQPLFDLAKQSQASAFISVTQGNECMVIMVADPEESLMRVGYRIGSRHPLHQGAAGIAILSGRKAHPEDSEAVIQGRELGYSLTHGQLQPGAIGVASPISRPHNQHFFEACVGVVALNSLDLDIATQAVPEAAAIISQLLGAATA